MKKSIKTFGIVALLSLAAFAASLSTTPEMAAANSGALQSKLNHFSNDGFRMESSTTNQYQYLIAPEGDYTWGTISYRFGKNDEDIEHIYIVTDVVATIEYKDRNNGSGFVVTNIETVNFNIK